MLFVAIGGGGGIRTLDTVTRITVFETAPFNHSGTPPSIAAAMAKDAYHFVSKRARRSLVLLSSKDDEKVFQKPRRKAWPHPRQPVPPSASAVVSEQRLHYLLHELQPMGYHLVNVLLHSAVCFLYVQLCGVVFGEAWPALIAGLLFAVHPIHTEAVSCCAANKRSLQSGLAALLWVELDWSSAHLVKHGTAGDARCNMIEATHTLQASMSDCPEF